MNLKEIKKLCEQYLRYKYEYYVLSQPTIPDSEFDTFENYLKNTNHQLTTDVTNLVDFPSVKVIKNLGLEPANIVDNTLSLMTPLTFLVKAVLIFGINLSIANLFLITTAIMFPIAES